MKKLIFPIALILFNSWQTPKSLKGTWQFAGGIYNGKKEAGTTNYKLQRKYNAVGFDAFMLEAGQQPFKYQSGNYILKSDSCLETETFSAEPSKLTGKMIHYKMQIRQDTLILNGTLPTGMKLEEYWLKVK